MLDIQYIRENAGRVKEGMRQKGEEKTDIVDQVLSVDDQWRERTREVDELRHQSNTRAREIGILMGQGKKE